MGKNIKESLPKKPIETAIEKQAFQRITDLIRKAQPYLEASEFGGSTPVGLYRILSYIAGSRTTLFNDDMNQIHALICEALPPGVSLFEEEQGPKFLNREGILRALSIPLLIDAVRRANLHREVTETEKVFRETGKRVKKEDLRKRQNDSKKS